LISKRIVLTTAMTSQTICMWHIVTLAECSAGYVMNKYSILMI
jgi:hypothetical protein